MTSHVILFKNMDYAYNVMSKTLLFFFPVVGHGMIVDGHPVVEPWGRRLMASETENKTVKNCSDPGILL